MRRCKIHQSGTDNYFYAISGVTSDRQIGFDANDLFAKRRRGLHGAESLDAIGASFLPQLQKHLDLLKKQAPNRYNSIVQSGSWNLCLPSIRLVMRDKATSRISTS
jgi:hypothetical protein